MSPKHLKPNQKHFYGAATLGEKGQIVIPREAREKMNLKKGDHLLVFGLHDDMLAVAKPTHVEKIAAHFSQAIKGGQSKEKNNG